MSILPRTVFDNSVRFALPSFGKSHLVSEFDNFVSVEGTCAGVSSTSAYMETITERRPELDITFNCAFNDQGVIAGTASITGSFVNVVFSSSTTSLLSSSSSICGTFVEGVVCSGLLETVTASLRPNDTFIPFASVIKTNWVAWSDIGNLSFTIGRSNTAGERPLDWKGYVYSIKKLLGKLVVYGENGVSYLIPAGQNFGLQTVYRIGLLGQQAAAGSDTKQYFVDSNGKLWKINSEGIKGLGFEEYLSEMNKNIVLSYDGLNDLLYICDGIYGYVLNCSNDSLGKCSPNITGIGYQSRTRYVGASSAITTSPFEICTDIFDLGGRNGKTVFSLEFGIDAKNTLYAAVDYRRNKASDFSTTSWVTVSPGGKARLVAWGREFRFRLKLTSYELIELDYIRVNGVADVH